MLGSLQLRILRLLSELPEQPILFGGGAIIGIHSPHRTTYDLDLMWSPTNELGDRTKSVERALLGDSLSVERLVTSPAFVRLRVSAASESTIVDLVAEPATRTRESAEVSGVPVWAPPAIDLLTDKLCALLSRQEGRDLQDVHALIGTGRSLEAALRLAPSRDGGFSALTLAWVLRGWPMSAVAKAAGWDAEMVTTMSTFRDELVAALTTREAKTEVPKPTS